MNLITMQISVWIVIALAACADGNARSETQAFIASPVIQSASQPADMQVKSVGRGDAPDEDALKQLIGSATQNSTVQLANDPDELLSSRILDGFEAAPRVLTTEAGQAITWGFKYKEASLQSVVIADASGQLQLVAAVTDVLSLSNGGTNAITTEAAYSAMVKQLALHPDVVLFARDQAALNAAYPLFKRWMEANLLGFNSSCQAQAAACALLPNIRIPTRVYLASGKDGTPIKVAVPTLPAAQIPPEKFTQ